MRQALQDAPHDRGQLLRHHIAHEVVEEQGERGRERERDQVARMGQLVERFGEVLVPERRRRDVRVRRQRQDRRESDEVKNSPEALPADEDEGERPCSTMRCSSRQNCKAPTA